MTELLADLKVLDLSLWQPGHTATQLLADLGADVLKVEPPGGDRERVLPDRVANFYGHKRSLVLDLKQAPDRARLLALAAQADVVVEGYRPGVADRLGAGYAALSAVNPALVYCSITGFGQTGPLADATGHDHNYQAYAGAFVKPPAGGAPVGSGALIGNQGSGMAAAFAILAAVHCARRTGEGDHIDVSTADLLLSWVAPAGTIGEAPQAPTHRPETPGMGVYAAGDGGHVVLGVFTENHFWDLLCDQLGLSQFAGLDHAARTARATEIAPALEARLASHTRDQLMVMLEPLGLPIAPVLSRAEALAHPHYWVRGVMARGPDGDRRVAHPIRYLRHPARAPGRPPAVGERGERGFGG